MNRLGGRSALITGAARWMGRAGNLTGMAVFLASTAADCIVAQTYNVDGGNWMS